MFSTDVGIGDLFDLNILDTMVAGLPIVSTNTYSIPEVIEGNRNRYLFDPPFSWHDNNFLQLNRSFDYPFKKLEEFVDRLYGVVSNLINRSQLRRDMGQRKQEARRDRQFLNA